MEFRTGNSEENSEPTDWGIIFTQLIKICHLSIDEIKELSYPQFKAIYGKMFDDKTFDIFVPYLGSSDSETSSESIKRNSENEILNREELMQVIAESNSMWK